MLLLGKDGGITPTGIASGVDRKQCGQRKDAVDPRVGDHGWGRNVDAGLGAAPAGRVGLGGGKSPAKKAAVKLPSLADGVGAVAAPHGAAPSR